MFYMYMKEGYLNNLKHKMCLNYFILVLLTTQFHADSLTALTHSARIYNVNGREAKRKPVKRKSGVAVMLLFVREEHSDFKFFQMALIAVGVYRNLIVISDH